MFLCVTLKFLSFVSLLAPNPGDATPLPVRTDQQHTQLMYPINITIT